MSFLYCKSLFISYSIPTVYEYEERVLLHPDEFNYLNQEKLVEITSIAFDTILNKFQTHIIWTVELYLPHYQGLTEFSKKSLDLLSLKNIFKFLVFIKNETK